MDFIIQQSLKLVESGLVPDQAIRAAIRALSKKRLIQEGRYDPEQAAQRYMDVLNTLKHSEIAIETDKANEQHYELPTEFFQAALGKRLKYSACYFPTTKTTLDEAEEFALQIYCERAQLKDGQQILELGCGWGSFTLWMAERYPNASIKGVSNSATQRQHILAQAKQRGLNNIEILTCDVNVLELEKGQFDRVVSVEMFEHVRNYQRLFEKIQTWLKDDGLLWCHIFCHRFLHYPFEIKNEYDWMSKYFFTGGLMPSVSTFLHFQDHLELSQQWQWSGEHYERTANAWLENMDAHETELKPLFEKIYAQDADAWWQRWRIFFMACAELFGFDQGQEWVVGHYLFKKKAA
ncbi:MULTISPECIES: cyclopropane-fatty-acyl-phospholipid synthase family protein [Acinetobacter]|uniref:SAM-dependent methyltransferase n=1 Tax=Acinetobacter TaxID=469 RepID=UPI000E5B79D2|nr:MULTISPECIES: cyclopropane-fatty-acyl-phospholipid synthase family protein [Acinetobacter]MCE6007398.1 cyclopropane-fatty-acyl-phospholipid synthase family protein [Acinetobacter soli]MCF3127896.1 cyclopropane-fatty-acyl-phospholipid synthase family protein [Acinetobacter soli]MCL9676865.1 cyclopropane-fatty-acyl-phospholipid synthase family protein [Acinetobacter sp. ACZLY 512]WOQ37724.1 cyclopropane-fatty-acyl-phospholipid synthase family protein [Acinetobacter soli]